MKISLSVFLWACVISCWITVVGTWKAALKMIAYLGGGLGWLAAGLAPIQEWWTTCPCSRCRCLWRSGARLRHLPTSARNSRTPFRSYRITRTEICQTTWRQVRKFGSVLRDNLDKYQWESRKTKTYHGGGFKRLVWLVFAFWDQPFVASTVRHEHKKQSRILHWSDTLNFKRSHFPPLGFNITKLSWEERQTSKAQAKWPNASYAVGCI